MIYNFDDIYNKEMYINSKIIFVTGQYPVFNDLVIDKFKDFNKTEVENSKSEMLDEFGYDTSEIKQLNKVSFDEFMQVKNKSPLQGKWYCSFEFSELSKKQQEMFMGYYKNPSDKGVLVVNMLDFKVFKKYLRDKFIKNSTDVNLIKLNFPTKKALTSIVQQMLGSVPIEPKAMALFIMRMGKDYNEYNNVLGRLSMKYQYSSITYKDMLLELKGIANFVIDDYIIKLAEPLKTTKVSKRKKVYTIQKALVNDLGYRSFVNKLRHRIKDLVEMRILINKGEVPVGIKYNVKKVQQRLPEKHTLKKLSEYSFRCLSEIATKFCLRDLVVILTLLNTVGKQSSDYEFARVINTISNRTSFEKERLLADLEIIDICDKIDIDCLRYDEDMQTENQRIVIDQIYHI